MKQIRNNKSDKNTKGKILKEKLSESTIDLIIEMKVRALINLFIRTSLLQTALKEAETGIIGAGELHYILFTDDKLLKDYSFSRDRNRKILDIKTVNGQKKLMTIFEGVRSIKVNIFEKECFDPLLSGILYLGMYIYKNMTPEYFLLFTKIENDFRETTCEAIGYWTAKLEEVVRNRKGGGDKMKDKGEKTSEAIEKILDKLQIKSLLDFKKDKTLRENFIDEAKAETKKVDATHNVQRKGTPLDKKTIYDKARKILKERKVTV